jgi:hypothetical protein
VNRVGIAHQRPGRRACILVDSFRRETPVRHNPLPLLAVIASSATLSAAPVPKELGKQGAILIAGEPTGVARLTSADGEPVREWAVPNAHGWTLAPGAKRVAVFVRVEPQAAKPGGPSVSFHHDLYVLPTTFDTKRDALGEPFATGFFRPTAAWAEDGKTLYVSDMAEDAKGDSVLPGVVTACDVVNHKTRTEEALGGRCVTAVSPDGRRLLAGRVVADSRRPNERRWRTELLSRPSLDASPFDARKLEFTHFLGADKVLGVRSDDRPAKDKLVVFDLKDETFSPLPLPKEVTDGEFLQAVPSPDGRRVLFVSRHEEKPKPVAAIDNPVAPRLGLPGGGGKVVMTHRMHTADLDGKNVKALPVGEGERPRVLDWR